MLSLFVQMLDIWSGTFSIGYKATEFVTLRNRMRPPELRVDAVEYHRIAGQVVVAAEFGDFRAVKGLSDGAVCASFDDDGQLVLFLIHSFNKPGTLIIALNQAILDFTKFSKGSPSHWTKSSI